MEVTDGFTGLDLIHRVLEELWMEVHDIVQKAVIKSVPKKKICKKAKWLSEEALQIAEKRSNAKGKGEEEKYTLVTEEGFLIFPCYSLKLCIQMGLSFPFSFAFYLSSFLSYL